MTHPRSFARQLILGFVLLDTGAALAQTPVGHGAADEDRTALLESRPRVELEALLGTSRAPYAARAFPEVSGYVALTRLDAELPLSRSLVLGARLPLVLARVQQPAGALYAEAAWANPELSVGYTRNLFRRDGWTLVGQASGALGLPLAEHASRSSQLEGRALSLADAIEGYGEPELYTPGVLPFTAKTRWTLSSRRWEFTSLLKLPVLLRVSEADLPPETVTRSVAFIPVLELAARFWMTHSFGISTAPRLSLRARSAVDEGDVKAQLLLPAALWLRVGEHLELGARFQAPLGGSLGGTTFGGGVSATAIF